jgi:anti-anti-sigma factor
MTSLRRPPPLPYPPTTGGAGFQFAQPVNRTAIVDRGTECLCITADRVGPVAHVHVSGELTQSGNLHLAALLDTMISAGCERVVVHLAQVSMVDSTSLKVLRAARTQLEGRLTVVADRVEVWPPLTLAGVERDAWPINSRPETGASHALSRLERRRVLPSPTP